MRTLARRFKLCGLALLLCLSVAVPVWAQSGGGYNLTWSTIDGGGGTSAGGIYALSGTAGQPDAGPAMRGGGYTLVGGFWSGGASFTSRRAIYLPLVLRAYDPNRSALSDPAGDWLPGAVQLASSDIRAASVERRPAESVLILTMQLAGDLPATLPADQRNRWVWLLDTDRNALTGDPWYDLGVEYEVNLHIQSDGFYVDVRDVSDNWTPVPDAAAINGNKVTVQLPTGYIGGATRCNWMSVVEPFDRSGVRFDIAPNSGYVPLP